MNHSISPEKSNTAIHRYVLLHGKYCEHEELLDCVRLQTEGLYWRLDAYRTYTARWICGEPFWALLTTHERKLVGSCISHLVRYGQLPLVKVSAHGSYPNKYEAIE